jgi:hypothetical protein
MVKLLQQVSYNAIRTYKRSESFPTSGGDTLMAEGVNSSSHSVLEKLV